MVMRILFDRWKGPIEVVVERLEAGFGVEAVPAAEKAAFMVSLKAGWQTGREIALP